MAKALLWGRSGTSIGMFTYFDHQRNYDLESLASVAYGRHIDEGSLKPDVAFPTETYDITAELDPPRETREDHWLGSESWLSKAMYAIASNQAFTFSDYYYNSPRGGGFQIPGLLSVDEMYGLYVAPEPAVYQ